MYFKFLFAHNITKWNLVNIPEPEHGDWPFRVQCGNSYEPGDVGASTGKSSLFFVRDGHPWNRLGRR